MGGKQFWTDHRWHNGWRLQHNVMTDHWRVVDPKNTRRAWGGRLACQKVFDEAAGKDIACAKHVVVLIHGLMRTTGSMKAIAEAIKQETDMQPAAFGYSSTRDSIARHSAAFREWVENLPGEPQISIVGHSLGNIVTRHAIGEWQLEDPRGVLKRLDRVVMLGPPNNGSSLAKKLSRLGLFEVVTGQSGLELGPQWDKLQSRLAIPPCEFAIISGDMSESSLRNPLTPAEGDLVVTVEETFLPGARTLTVPVLHSFLPNDARAVQPTIRFLKHESLEGE
jgi:triacylglycerol esterase/lipase EstA (alpha/beta hydrolase family)